MSRLELLNRKETERCIEGCRKDIRAYVKALLEEQELNILSASAAKIQAEHEALHTSFKSLSSKVEEEGKRKMCSLEKVDKLCKNSEEFSSLLTQLSNSMATSLVMEKTANELAFSGINQRMDELKTEVANGIKNFVDQANASYKKQNVNIAKLGGQFIDMAKKTRADTALLESRVAMIEADMQQQMEDLSSSVSFLAMDRQLSCRVEECDSE